MEEISSETQELIEKANKIYLQNFPAETCFERALFFSWYCSIRDCKFCFMSTQPDNPLFKKIGIRTQESLIAETILCKNFGWDFGFLSGGIGAFEVKEFKEIIKNITTTYGDKIWLNMGPMSKKVLQDYLPHIKGVVGSIETINEEVHKDICPSKPIEPYLKMFDNAQELGLKKAITIITGVGETKQDFPKMAELIKKYKIDKIHLYSLVPEKGTPFETTKMPTLDYHAWWIAKTRIEFPQIDIQCGIWSDRVERISTLLKAGANSISKFPVIRRFGTKLAKEIEEQAQKAERTFKGSLTKIPDVNWEQEIKLLDIPEELKPGVNKRVQMYLKMMNKNLLKHSAIIIQNEK